MVRDYISKFLIVRKLANSATQVVKKDLSDIFCEYGRPYLFRSDNYPCYASEEF